MRSARSRTRLFFRVNRDRRSRVSRSPSAWLKDAHMKPRALLGSIGLSLLATLLVACSSSETKEEPQGLAFAPGAPWPKFRADAAQTGRSALVPKASGGKLWELETRKGIFSAA